MTKKTVSRMACFTAGVLLIFFAADRAWLADFSFHCIVINPGSGKSGDIGPWARMISYPALKRWARGMGMSLLRDQPPLIGNTAAFVSRYGSAITVNGLKPYHQYRLWIDFVAFKGVGLDKFSSRLEISIDNQVCARIPAGSLNERNNPYLIQVPYNCSADGTFTIAFREYSMAGSFWGIWDIIVSDAHSLDDIAGMVKNTVDDKPLEIKDRLLEKKGPPAKKRDAQSGQDREGDTSIKKKSKDIRERDDSDIPLRKKTPNKKSTVEKKKTDTAGAPGGRADKNRTEKQPKPAKKAIADPNTPKSP